LCSFCSSFGYYIVLSHKVQGFYSTQAVAKRPFDLQRVKVEHEKVLEKLGNGALVEAASAAMEGATVAADMTRKQPFDPFRGHILFRVVEMWLGL
jgi:hypothetical protein